MISFLKRIKLLETAVIISAVSIGILYSSQHLEAALSLNINTTAYLVGEAPTYTISGATPNSQIKWSSTRNGSSTGENSAYYGQITNGSGYWQGSGASWQSSQLGQWTKTATIGTASMAASFGVYTGTISASPVSCQSPCNVSISWTSNSNNIVRIYRTPSFSGGSPWNLNPNGSNNTDWNLAVGAYQYCLRIVDASWK